MPTYPLNSSSSKRFPATANRRSGARKAGVSEQDEREDVQDHPQVLPRANQDENQRDDGERRRDPR